VKIAYVLSYPELSGGVKVVFQHARLLKLQGHDVTVLGLGSKPDWLEVQVNYIDYSQGQPRVGQQDLVIATYFTTIAVAEAMDLGPVAHFCQGYEGDFVHLAKIRPEIEAAYSRPLPTLTVSPHLVQLLSQRFGRAARVVSPPIDDTFRPAVRLCPRKPAWIFIPGVFESEPKGVKTALQAVRLLRDSGLSCRVLRCSALPMTEEERELLEADRYLLQVPAAEVAHHLRECDLMLFASLPNEGFGLPLLEAMVSKVPVICSAIPSVEFIGDNDLTVVPPRDAAAFATKAAQMLGNPISWHKARERGYKAAQKFHPRVIDKQLSQAVEWAREASRVAV
jgi:glycosyltransferase involved in cell wall biosynthesis